MYILRIWVRHFQLLIEYLLPFQLSETLNLTGWVREPSFPVDQPFSDQTIWLAFVEGDIHPLLIICRFSMRHLLIRPKCLGCSSVKRVIIRCRAHLSCLTVAQGSESLLKVEEVHFDYQDRFILSNDLKGDCFLLFWESTCFFWIDSKPGGEAPWAIQTGSQFQSFLIWWPMDFFCFASRISQREKIEKDHPECRWSLNERIERCNFSIISFFN